MEKKIGSDHQAQEQNAAMKETWIYEKLQYRTISGIEYTILRFTDLARHIAVWIEGYHQIPSPGEFTKLATIPNPPVKFSGMVPEFPITFFEGNEVLVEIANTAYHGYQFPA